MTAPTRLGPSRTLPYGFALATGELHGKQVIGHTGAIPGFRTESLYFPEEDVFVAVMVNSDNPNQTPEQVARSLARVYLQSR